MAGPAVSVVMPVYNAQTFVAEAVRSVLAQTFADFECIAVDDGSTDDSLAILRQLAADDDRLRIITRANTGIVGALNDGLAAARGEFIARMDADDVCMPTRFERQVEYLRAHADVVALGTWVQEIDRFDSPLAQRRTPVEHDAIDAAHLAGHGGQIAHPSVMMRHDAVERIGGYREAFPFAEDLDLFLRLAEVGRLANLPDTLLHYRQHEANVCFTRQGRQRQSIAAAVADACQRRGIAAPSSEGGHCNTGSLAERVRSWTLHAIRAGRLDVARRHARRLVCCQPWRPESWRIMYWALRG